MPENWEQLQRELNVSPVLARVLSARGVASGSDVDLTLARMLPPDGLAGIQHAAARLVYAIDNHERIFVSGDFDADGATASALCVSLLSEFGAKHVGYVVPNRFQFGYGLTRPYVESLLEQNPDVIITVDNGISSNDGIAFARDQGIDVIVTDHHLPPEHLPAANVIVNPQLDKGSFPSAPAGVGVAFYLMVELRRQLRNADHFGKNRLEEPNVASYLDLVALGTIVDLVPLDQNNRILVGNGLQRMRSGRCRPGIAALCEASNVDSATINEEDLGYRLGPRINAAGRLEDISLGIQALIANDLREARKCVSKLNAINVERREIQTEMTDMALRYLDTVAADDRKGICIHEASFHEGVVGLVANQIVTKLSRPAVVFAVANDGKSEMLKGSARSTPNVHIRDVLADIDARYPHLIKSFGGHAMAAGLTIHGSSLDRFSNLFESAVAARTPAESFGSTVHTDGELKPNELSMDLVREIDKWGPWGQEFERPLFHGSFNVVSEVPVGNRKHVKLVLKMDARVVDAIAFNQRPVGAPAVEISYRPSANRFAGVTTLQLIVDSLQPSAM